MHVSYMFQSSDRKDLNGLKHLIWCFSSRFYDFHVYDLSGTPGMYIRFLALLSPAGTSVDVAILKTSWFGEDYIMRLHKVNGGLKKESPHQLCCKYK